ncbi:hypothetical protein [Streptomyces sp. UG1]|uniref:hypothetical protein n=1 Tax=Streptomyces sp. UG1 TaxID=3417652 RepID=UPI003CF21042
MTQVKHRRRIRNELPGETTLADAVEALRLRSRWNSGDWWRPLRGTSAGVAGLAVTLPPGLRPVAWILPAPLVGTLLGSLYDRMRLPGGRLQGHAPLVGLPGLPGDRRPVRSVGRRHGGRHVRAARAGPAGAADVDRIREPAGRRLAR